uniref:TLDc domain-containing protein n=1 Tax=Chromera velia CCMP2878 TaxID=1169474 RepID=A0A0G4F422_9ALVE|eukprot:Cvel_15090.t1-p1 / transcript=Cvel_15090.t1 / gene=Cvel_15090 / organism=Chromera_velia_CCMP2878 / gene_product=hypothetical protein / transcript_product=hypothetical protein / location=Cvel_scaffold1101:12231-13202(-) / protein_length=324 / sequence_SO=supercontig / SO=protein_coding / is_pseudo=false
MDISAQISACYEKNVGIFGRIEARKEIRTFSYSVRWPAMTEWEVDRLRDNLFRPKASPEVKEYVTVQKISEFVDEWKFADVLRDDFEGFVKLIPSLNRKASPWEEIKTLNEEIKKVAASLCDFCRDGKGGVTETGKNELSKFLDNLQRIQKALYDLEEKAMGEDSRLTQLKRDVALKAKQMNDFFRQAGLHSFPLKDFTAEESLILSPDQRSLLASWYPGEWTLVYRGTRDGMNASAFHERADGKGPTVTVIKTGDNVFGGYTGVSWGRKANSVANSTASVFILHSSLGLEPQRFRVIGDVAIYDKASDGPTFGTHDICCFEND